MDAPDVGRLVVFRRVKMGYKTRADLAKAAGITARTLGDIEKGRRSSYSASTLARVEQALDWHAGQIQTLFDTDIPMRPPSEDPPSPSVDKRALASEIAHHIHRDDFSLSWLLAHSGLSEAAIYRLIQHIRQRREKENAELLAEVEGMVREVGGVVSYPGSAEGIDDDPES